MVFWPKDLSEESRGSLVQEVISQLEISERADSEHGVSGFHRRGFRAGCERCR